MRILVFTEGTIIDDRNREGDWKLIGGAATKLRHWQDHGATIAYLSSKREEESLRRVKRVLRNGRAPEGELFFRKGGEHYGEAALRANPEMIVEDDCRSIGGRGADDLA